MSNTKFHIGCSSFATPSWKSVFYPDDLPKKDWFQFYCTHFSTYEFNGSFYRSPTVESLDKWYDKTPDDFSFSIKIPKVITHTKKLVDCEIEVSDFYEIVSKGLKEKLACVLWQFPPSFLYSELNLAKLIKLLNSDFKNVVEFRHKSWWNKNAVETLQQTDVIFCNPSYPGLDVDLIDGGKIGYFRMHGVPKLFYSEYSQEEIQKLFNTIKAASYKEVYVYFNNTASTAAVINAMQFMKLKDSLT